MRRGSRELVDVGLNFNKRERSVLWRKVCCLLVYRIPSKVKARY